MRRRQRWPLPDAIAPRGRVAGVATGGGLAVAGLAHAAASWNELTTCTGLSVGTARAEVDAQALCDVVGAVAGLWFLLSLALAAAGIAVISVVLARPTVPTGPHGWSWGWGALAAAGGMILATRVSTSSCPPGFRLDAAFALCLRGGDRVAAASNLPLKGAIALGAIALGVTLARSRRIPAPVASAVALATWFAGTGWLLVDTVGRDLVAA